jgi:hypothetical protein
MRRTRTAVPVIDLSALGHVYLKVETLACAPALSLRCHLHAYNVFALSVFPAVEARSIAASLKFLTPAAPTDST